MVYTRTASFIVEKSAEVLSYWLKFLWCNKLVSLLFDHIHSLAYFTVLFYFRLSSVLTLTLKSKTRVEMFACIKHTINQ
jgi:hypothetical protein